MGHAKEPWLLVGVLALLSLLGCATFLGERIATHDLAGRYSQTFTNSSADGEPDPFQSTDVLEILPISQQQALFNIELNFRNGHTCQLAGVGTLTASRLVYVTPSDKDGGDVPCKLTIWRDSDLVRWSDGSNSCQRNCGMRGSLAAGAIEYSTRQPLKLSRARQLRRQVLGTKFGG